MKMCNSLQALSVIYGRDFMILGMRLTYRLPYACQYGRVIKDFFTAESVTRLCLTK